MKKELKTKYLIIGAGVSGLSFARNLKDEYIILEKETEVGGYCRTIKKAGFIWDYAGHFFHFSDSKIKAFFEKKMPSETLVNVNKCTKIYYKNKLIDYPFQTNIHQLEKDDFIDCLYWLFNREEKEDYSNFMEMLYGKFGKGITDRFLKPYNEKLYACNLNNLDKDAMGRFFPYADLNQIINNMKIEKANTYNDSFMYPKEGAFEFVKVLLDDVIRKNIICNQEVINIDIKNKSVETGDYIVKYEYLVNTGSFKQLMKFTNQETSLINGNKVLVFNLGFDKKSYLTHEHWIYFPEKEYNFYRVGFYDNILGQNRLSLYVEIGYTEEQEINVEKELGITIENLRKCGIIDNHKLIAKSVCIMNPAYAHISTEGKQYVEMVLEKFEQDNIYSIGRYGAWTYCSIEDCILQANRLYERIINEKEIA